MSLFASLYTGVNGMNAQSQATAGISENIANMNTVGYKKYDTAFQDLVVNNTRSARFASGGVFTTQVQRIDQQGSLKGTHSQTDVGITGQGFFTVKTADDPAEDFLFTRNGSFSPDAEGLLRNSAGFVLYGWTVDQDGNAVGGNDLGSLVAVDINSLDSQFLQTTTGELGINLKADEDTINPHLQNPAQSLPVGNVAPHFVRNMTVYDGTGTARDLIFEFRKITGPMAYATSQTAGTTLTDSMTDPAFFGNINAGDTFTVNAGAVSQQYIIGAPAGAGQVRVDTLGDLTHDINTNLGGGTVMDASLDSSGRLVLQMIDPTANLSLTEDVGTPLTGTGTLNLATQPGNPALTYTSNAPLNGGAAYPDQADLPAFSNTASPNTHGWWEVTILTNDPADPDGTVLPPVAISGGMMNFNGDGTMNAVADASGEFTINLANIDFDNGVGGEEIASLSLDVSRFSQFAGAYNVLITDQNGAEAGTLIGVEVERDGLVTARFTNGQEVGIYRIPLADFVNPNGLQAITGTVFALTEDAGDISILGAGTGGVGFMQSAAVENSNVDLADEFANLIVSQRAFSANSRVVNTVDEMTQQLKQLKT